MVIYPQKYFIRFIGRNKTIPGQSCVNYNELLLMLLRDRDLSAQDIEEIFEKKLGTKAISFTPIYLRLKKLEENEIVRSYRYKSGMKSRLSRTYFQLTIKGEMLLEQLKEFRYMFEEGSFS